MPLRVGTAGWLIPASTRERFSEKGSSLERYASRFTAAEINSCFYRPHRRSTYERWAASVPTEFRFSAKLPKTISHGGKLGGSADLIRQFAEEVGGLGPKLGVVLAQFPPSLAFDIAPVSAMFDTLRSCLHADIACEPRHRSWFNESVDAFLATEKVARVVADPVRGANGERPGGWRDLAYYRLHGSPRVYYSSYDTARLREIHMGLLQDAAIASSTWCVFDNTASSAATANALDLFEMFRSQDVS